MQNQSPSANARIVAFDLVAFVALAAAIALSAAVVLTAVVLLLAGRAEASPAGEEKQGILLLRTMEDKASASTPLLSTDVSFRVSGLAAVPTNLPEGWEYDKVFGELPQGATDSRYAMLTGALLLLLALTMLLAQRPRRFA